MIVHFERNDYGEIICVVTERRRASEDDKCRYPKQYHALRVNEGLEPTEIWFEKAGDEIFITLNYVGKDVFKRRATEEDRIKYSTQWKIFEGQGNRRTEVVKNLKAI